MWKYDVTKEVDAFGKFADLNLIGMERESAFTPEPLFDEWQEPLELSRVVSKNNRIVSVAEIVLHSEFVFDKVVECVHVDIRK